MLISTIIHVYVIVIATLVVILYCKERFDLLEHTLSNPVIVQLPDGPLMTTIYSQGGVGRGSAADPPQ